MHSVVESNSTPFYYCTSQQAPPNNIEAMGLRSRLSRRRSKSPRQKKKGKNIFNGNGGGNGQQDATDESQRNKDNNKKQEEMDQQQQQQVDDDDDEGDDDNFDYNPDFEYDDESSMMNSVEKFHGSPDEVASADKGMKKPQRKVSRADSMSLSLERLSQTINNLESQLGSSTATTTAATASMSTAASTASGAAVAGNNNNNNNRSTLESSLLGDRPGVIREETSSYSLQVYENESNDDDDMSNGSVSLKGTDEASSTDQSHKKDGSRSNRLTAKSDRSTFSLTVEDLMSKSNQSENPQQQQQTPKAPLHSQPHQPPKRRSSDDDEEDDDDSHKLSTLLSQGEQSAPLKTEDEQSTSSIKQQRRGSSESVLQCLLENKPMADFEVSESNELDGVMDGEDNNSGSASSNSNSNDNDANTKDNNKDKKITPTVDTMSAYDKSLSKSIRRASRIVMNQALFSPPPPTGLYRNTSTGSSHRNSVNNNNNNNSNTVEFEGKIADLARGLEEVRLSLFQVNEDAAYESMATRQNFEKLNGTYKVMQEEQEKMRNERSQLFEMIQRQNDRIEEMELQMEAAAQRNDDDSTSSSRGSTTTRRQQQQQQAAELEELRREIEAMKKDNAESYNEFQAIGHAIAEHIHGFFRHLADILRGEEEHQYQDDVEATYAKNAYGQGEFKRADSDSVSDIPPPGQRRGGGGAPSGEKRTRPRGNPAQQRAPPPRTKSRLEEVAESGFKSKRAELRRTYSGDVSLGGSFRANTGLSNRFGRPMSTSPSNGEDESSLGNDIDSLTGGGSGMLSPRKAWDRVSSFRGLNTANPQETPSSPKNTNTQLSPTVPNDDDSTSQRDILAGAMQRQRRSSIIGRVGAVFQSNNDTSSFPDDDHLNIMSRYLKEKSYSSDRSEHSGRSGRSTRSSSLRRSNSMRSQRSSTMRSQRSSQSNNSSRSGASGRKKKNNNSNSGRKSRSSTDQNAWNNNESSSISSPSKQSNRGLSSDDRIEKSPWSKGKKMSRSSLNNPMLVGDDNLNTLNSLNNPMLTGGSPARKWGDVPEPRLRKSGEFSSDTYISPLDRVRMAHGCSKSAFIADFLEDSENADNAPRKYGKTRSSIDTEMTAGDFMGAAGNSAEDLSALARLDEFEKSFGELALEEDEEELDGTQKLSNLTSNVVVVPNKPRGAGRRSSMVSELTGHGELSAHEESEAGAPAPDPTSMTIEKVSTRRGGRPSRRSSVVSELSHGTARGHHDDHDDHDDVDEGGDDDKDVASDHPVGLVGSEIQTRKEAAHGDDDVGADSFESSGGPSPTNMRLEMTKQNSLHSVTSEISMDQSSRRDGWNRYVAADEARSEKVSDSEQKPAEQDELPTGKDMSAQKIVAKKPDQSRRESNMSSAHNSFLSPGSVKSVHRPEDLSLSVNLERLNLRWGTTGDEDLDVNFPDISGSFNQSAAWERVSSILAEEDESEGADSLGALERKSNREQLFARPDRFRLTRRGDIESERSLIKETIKEENSDDEEASTSHNSSKNTLDRGLNLVPSSAGPEDMSTSNETPGQLRRQLSMRSVTERSNRSEWYDDLSHRWGYWNESEPIESPLPAQAKFLSPAVARNKKNGAWGRMSALFLDESFSAEDEELNSINREVRNATSASSTSGRQQTTITQPSVTSSVVEESVTTTTTSSSSSKKTEQKKKSSWGFKNLLRPVDLSSAKAKQKKPDEQTPAAHGAWRKAERIAKIATV